MEDTITLKKKNVQAAFQNADAAGKKMLAYLCPEIVSPKIIDRIKTFDDACEEQGIDRYQDKFIKGEPDDIAFQKLKVIARALNQEWKPNWNDSNQKNWYPCFCINIPGFCLRYSRYVCDFTYMLCGSRLCYETEELSNYAATQFLDLYNNLLN